jgi:hypothetical protein
MRVAHEHVRLPDRRDPVEHVQDCGNHEHDAGERDEALAVGVVIVVEHSPRSLPPTGV